MGWLANYLAERRATGDDWPPPPEHPCRIMPTRHCPDVYEGVCGDRPCARFESEDETPWLPELETRPTNTCTCESCRWRAEENRP